MNMPNKCLAFCFILASSTGHVESAEESIVLLTTNYPPYEIEHPTDGREGFDTEVIKEIFTRLKINVEVIFIPWKRAIKKISEGQVVGGFSVADRPERHLICGLSDPVSRITPVLLAKKSFDGHIPDRLVDTKHLRGIGIRGYAYQQELADLELPHTILNSDDQALHFLVRGRADVFYTAKESSRYLAKKLNFLDQLQFIELEDRKTETFHVCFSKKWPGYEKYLGLFNKGLEQLKKDGTYSLIHAKY